MTGNPCFVWDGPAVQGTVERKERNNYYIIPYEITKWAKFRYSEEKAQRTQCWRRAIRHNLRVTSCSRTAGMGSEMGSCEARVASGEIELKEDLT